MHGSSSVVAVTPLIASAVGADEVPSVSATNARNIVAFAIETEPGVTLPALAFTPALGSAFTLIQNDGLDAVVGTFAGLPQDATLVLSGMTLQISYVGGTGNDVLLTRIA